MTFELKHLCKKKKILKNSYSRMISLPPEWIRQAGLKDDDRIQPIIQEDGTLLLKRFEDE